MAHEQMRAKEAAGAEARRAELDRQRALVKANPEDAKMYQHALGGTQSHAAVVIKIVNKDGSVVNYMTCELSVDVDGFTLVLVCPSCVFRHHRTQADSQITMRSWHRKFEVTSLGQNLVWSTPRELVPPGELPTTVTLAGAVETVDVQTCPVCNLRFHLEKSRDPSERGVTVLREA